VDDIYRRYDNRSQVADRNNSGENRQNQQFSAPESNFHKSENDMQKRKNVAKGQARPQFVPEAKNSFGNMAGKQSLGGNGFRPSERGFQKEMPSRENRNMENLRQSESHFKAKGYPMGEERQKENKGMCSEDTLNRKKTQRSLSDILCGFIPQSLYNSETGKILGFLDAEDLLIVALIFLFLNDKSGDNTLIVLALVYVLLSDYINLEDFAF